jgi:Protein of unknown function (DUF1559)/Domain of unknown function (DUF4190)
MIEFTCTCGRPFSVSENTRSGTVECPDCGKEIVVPGNRAHVTPQRHSSRPEFVEDDRPRRGRRFHDEPEPFMANGAAAGTSTKAIVSLVLGLASFLLFCVAGLPALIVGFMALGDIANSRGGLKGKGMAFTGITLGIISLVLSILVVPAVAIIPAIQKTREAAARMSALNNMKQIALSLENYHDSNGSFPQAYTLAPPPGGGPPQLGMSWRVAILPYIEQNNLYNMYNPQLPWDDPSNQFVRSTQIRTYQFPNDTTTVPTNTYYQVFVTVPGKSPHALFDRPTFPPQSVRMIHILDGSSNTIMLAEAPTAVPWASPQDMAFDPDQMPPLLGSHYRGVSLIATADGATRSIPTSINPATLKALITRDGNEIITDPDWR